MQEDGRELRSGSGCWREEPPYQRPSSASQVHWKALEGCLIPTCPVCVERGRGGGRCSSKAMSLSPGLEPRASHLQVQA